MAPNIDPAIWERIQSYVFDDSNATLSFSKRLARENHWSHGYALRVIEEYKKFAYLWLISGHGVTPSDEVDQVWHLHLVYTEEYWGNFCKNILQKPRHHGPTKGGQSEITKYDDLYTKTKESYEKVFGEVPPVDIWPTNDVRFGRDFKRLDIHDHVVIKKDDYPIISRIIILLFNILNLFHSKKIA